MSKSNITPALRYFFKKLERKSDEFYQAEQSRNVKANEVPFDEVERFARAIMTQNIFIHTVGINGKHESTILTKAMFSINKVVRLYYSTTLDENNQGYIRIRPDSVQQLILVERLHGYRPVPELLYASLDECHVIRFFISWLMRRIDWDKTKVSNLDLYKEFVEIERKEIEEEIAIQQAEHQQSELKNAIKMHFPDQKKVPTKVVSEK